MWPLLIVGQVMGGMRPASAASEAIEAEVSLKVWDVLHGTLRWVSEADGPCKAGLYDLRGHRGEVFLKVLDVLHPRAVGEGGGEQSELTAGVLAVVAEGSGLRVIHIIFQERKKKKPKKKNWGCAS